MITNVSLTAKASEDADRSDSIIVSFDSKWYEAIAKGKVSLVIRKRIPVIQKPNWLYLHLNFPRSSICARARIIAAAPMPIKVVHTFSTELCLSHREIDKYCGNLTEIGSYQLEDIELAPVEITTADIQDRLRYSPPQSFMFLSHRAKEIIDTLCKFGQIPITPRVRPE